MERITTDVLIVGSGAAGLCAAIAARQEGADVLVASLSPIGGGNATAVAGGLINAAIGTDDSPEIHYEDTLKAGMFLNDGRAVIRLVERMPRLLPRLEELGVTFAKDAAGYKLSRSPGHTRARTLVLDPRIGVTLSKPLADVAQALGARMIPECSILKIIVTDQRAAGAIGYLWREDQLALFAAKTLVLATGGAALLYSRTRIPPGVPGDAYGLALDAGATLQDMEFVQFYPTVLAEPGRPKVMIAYEHFLKCGAVLRNALDEDIVAKHGLGDPDMITRDQLSIALALEIYERRDLDGTVVMDLRRCRPTASTLYGASPFSSLLRRWPGQLPTRIRVAPANHYFMGGIAVGPDGCTDVEGLLACGEAAGGTHGANRLQGNALSETIVAGFDAGRCAASLAASTSQPDIPDRLTSDFAAWARSTMHRRSGTPVREILHSLQTTMSSKAGIIRDAASLTEAKAALASLRAELPFAIALTPKDRAHICTLSQLLDTAECIVAAALARAESRGAHRRLDHPQLDDAWLRHVTCAKAGGEITLATSSLENTAPISYNKQEKAREKGSEP